MKKVACIIGIVVGILAIILSFFVRDMSVGSFESDKSYGGDAYTGIQNAAAQSANNVQYTNRIAREGMGNILLIMGGICVAYFLKEMPEDTFKKKAVPQYTPVPGAAPFNPNPAPQQPYQVPAYQPPQQPVQQVPQNNPYSNIPPHQG